MQEEGKNGPNRTALLLVDVINHFDFPDGAELLQNSLRIAPAIRALKDRGRKAGVPVIYVNDNFGRWRSNFPQVLEHCRSCGADVRAFIDQLLPEPEDYVLLKPKHSGFYYTPLELLLKDLGTERLIVAGIATNSCILCTAQDANMRDIKLVVPADCCASRSAAEHDTAIALMSGMVGADVTPSGSPDFKLQEE